MSNEDDSKNQKIEPIRISFTSCEPKGGVIEDLSPVILLHGLLTTKHTWKILQHSIADSTKRKVYALDMRNHGYSGYSDVFSVAAIVEDLEHFMDEEKIAKAILIGHSFGGSQAMGLALKKPEKVEKLIVEEASLKAAPEHFVQFGKSVLCMLEQKVPLIPASIPERDVQKFLSKIFTSYIPKEFINGVFLEERNLSFPLSLESEGRYSLRVNVDPLLKISENKAAQIVDLTRSPVFKGPTLFICGAMSPLRIYKDENYISQYFPEAEFSIIDDAYHMIHVENPEKFFDLVLRFIQS